MSNVTIAFNGVASQAIAALNASKLRVETREGVLCFRPTNRKAGPHVLAELVSKGRAGLQFELDEAQVEKVGINLANFDVGTKFNVIEAKYGWYAATDGETDDEKAKGAKMSVTKR